jgi:hypothetical protein
MEMNAVNSYGQGSKSWEEVARNAMADRADLLRENTELKNFSAGLELNLAAVIQRAEAAERELADEKVANASVIKNWEDALSQCVRLEAKLGAIQSLAKANANRAA